MLEIMTKERMKKAGDVKKRPVEGDGSAERTASKPGSDSAADEDRVTRGRDLAQPHTDEMRCLNVFRKESLDCINIHAAYI